ncbi:response regulator transcription factor [Novosphingobium malaysiense]|nr:response regulator transcription factor [Novosphingobium malaysiense]
MGGHQVIAMTGDGHATLDAIRREDPEVVLLDVRMPGGDGISTLKALRERHDERPVIILTVEMTNGQVADAVRAGVNGIVFKHDSENRLLDAIDAVTNGLPYLDGKLIEHALSTPPASPACLAILTPKEQEVADHVARGLRNKDIAALLETTEGTIKVHLHRVYTKLGISNRTELAMMARTNETAR